MGSTIYPGSLRIFLRLNQTADRRVEGGSGQNIEQQIRDQAPGGLHLLTRVGQGQVLQCCGPGFVGMT